MIKIKILNAVFLSLLFLNSCGAVKEGLGGSKKKGSDEFLVEKKAPLVLPPSFGELPEPGSKKSGDVITSDDDTSFEKIIGKSQPTEMDNENNSSSNSIEEMVIKKNY